MCYCFFESVSFEVLNFEESETIFFTNLFLQRQFFSLTEKKSEMVTVLFQVETALKTSENHSKREWKSLQ